jgi:hypothetical protein
MAEELERLMPKRTYRPLNEVSGGIHQLWNEDEPNKHQVMADTAATISIPSGDFTHILLKLTAPFEARVKAVSPTILSSVPATWASKQQKTDTIENGNQQCSDSIQHLENQQPPDMFPSLDTATLLSPLKLTIFDDNDKENQDHHPTVAI